MLGEPNRQGRWSLQTEHDCTDFLGSQRQSPPTIRVWSLTTLSGNPFSNPPSSAQKSPRSNPFHPWCHPPRNLPVRTPSTPGVTRLPRGCVAYRQARAGCLRGSQDIVGTQLRGSFCIATRTVPPYSVPISVASRSIEDCGQQNNPTFYG